MKLSIIIVSYNTQERLFRNLSTLFAADLACSHEIFVVDNGSVDGSAKMVANSFPAVTLLANQGNAGFAKANNLAMVRAAGEYILLLNPDMQVARETLGSMLRWMDSHPQAAVASCRLVDETGKTLTNARRFPNLCNQLAIVFKLPHLFPGLLASYLCQDVDPQQTRQVQSVRGSFFLIRRTAVSLPENEIGEMTIPLLDERFFLWFEEVDYCRQLAACGRQVWYCAETSCIDYIGQSFARLPRMEKQGYFRDSMLAYFAKWHPRWQYLLLRLAWKVMWQPIRVLDFFRISSKADT